MTSVMRYVSFYGFVLMVGVLRLVQSLWSFLIRIAMSRKKRMRVPAVKSNLILRSAKELKKNLKYGELKAVDILEAYIGRIEEVDPILNCVVQERFTKAREEARKVDEIIESTAPDRIDSLFDEYPLLGIPFSVKESIPLKDMSNNAARSQVAGHVAGEDNGAIQLLRRAGGVPLVVSTTPELCYDIETRSYEHGRTNNPYDLRRTVGGSSGGEAALLGSAASLIGVGSDVGGSIRIPAMFCGVYGHKPTPGYVQVKGHIPESQDPKWSEYFVLGPMSRYCEDLELVLFAMIPHSKASQLREPVDLTQLKLYYMFGERSFFQDKIQFESQSAVLRVVEALKRELDCTTKQVDLGFNETFLQGFLVLQLKGVHMVAQEGWGLFRVFWFLVKTTMGLTHSTFLPVAIALSKTLFDRFCPRSWAKSGEEKNEKLKKDLEELLKDDGVLIYPTFPGPAGFHGTMSHLLPNITFCSVFNYIGVPVTQVPVGLTADGIPIGVQVVAAAHQDRLCLAVAATLEKTIGGWIPPQYEQT